MDYMWEKIQVAVAWPHTGKTSPSNIWKADYCEKMYAFKSNFPWHGVPCFQHIHQCPTRLTLPEGMSHPVFRIWKNPVESALVPVLCTQDHARHMHSAPRKGISAAPMPLHGGEGSVLQQSSATQGQTPVPCKPTTQTPRPPAGRVSQSDIAFSPKPKQSSPLGLPCTPLSLRHSWQNVPKFAKTCHQS